ncbi:hypothetical protein GCM10023320_73070 [Pseudonocardia adelaidensis]|uniref:LysR substrate-binding domain-containing protein n=1 Tax=Pseudonocardia adelaidensis TaxID=648754 RepID=A0ABP9P1W8_9PSEU
MRLFPVARGPMVLLCHPGHPVATGEPTWADLGAQVFVDFPPEWSIRELGDRAFAQAGQPREVELEVDDVHGLIDLVRHRLGVAIVPESVARKKSAAGLAVRPLPGAVEIDWEVAARSAPTSGRAPRRWSSAASPGRAPG